jgi:hypothetical protein
MVSSIISLIRRPEAAGRWQTLWKKRDEWLPGYAEADNGSVVS